MLLELLDTLHLSLVSETSRIGSDGDTHRAEEWLLVRQQEDSNKSAATATTTLSSSTLSQHLLWSCQFIDHVVDAPNGWPCELTLSKDLLSSLRTIRCEASVQFTAHLHETVANAGAELIECMYEYADEVLASSVPLLLPQTAESASTHTGAGGLAAAVGVDLSQTIGELIPSSSSFSSSSAACSALSLHLIPTSAVRIFSSPTHHAHSVTGLVSYSGVLCAVGCFDVSTSVADALQTLRQDLVRSMRVRQTLLVYRLEQEEAEAEEELKGVVPFSENVPLGVRLASDTKLLLPKRVFFASGSPIHFGDYVFPGDTHEDVLQQCFEILGLEVDELNTTLGEPEPFTELTVDCTEFTTEVIDSAEKASSNVPSAAASSSHTLSSLSASFSIQNHHQQGQHSQSTVTTTPPTTRTTKPSSTKRNGNTQLWLIIAAVLVAVLAVYWMIQQ